MTDLENARAKSLEAADRTVTPMEQIMEMIRKLDERIDDLEYKLRGIMLDD